MWLGIEFAILSLAHCLNWDFWDYWEVVLVVGGAVGMGWYEPPASRASLARLPFLLRKKGREGSSGGLFG